MRVIVEEKRSVENVASSLSTVHNGSSTPRRKSASSDEEVMIQVFVQVFSV